MRGFLVLLVVLAVGMLGGAAQADHQAGHPDWREATISKGEGYWRTPIRSARVWVKVMTGGREVEAIMSANGCGTTVDRRRLLAHITICGRRDRIRAHYVAKQRFRLLWRFPLKVAERRDRGGELGKQRG